MTPLEAVSISAITQLKASSAINTGTADDPEGDPGVYPVKMPQGAQFLPCLVYALSPSQDNTPMGQSQMSYYSLVVMAHALGRSFPHSLAAAASIALHGFKETRGGYVMHFERAGDIPPYAPTVDGKEFRTCGVRFTVRVSHSV